MLEQVDVSAPEKAEGGMDQTSHLRSRWCPQKESNLHQELRSLLLYPLSYGGQTSLPYRTKALLRRIRVLVRSRLILRLFCGTICKNSADSVERRLVENRLGRTAYRRTYDAAARNGIEDRYAPHDVAGKDRD